MEAGDLDPLTAPVDSDNDGTPDYLDPDSDNDTISDVFERLLDSDNDGIPNRLDLDSDNDGLTDAQEAGDLLLITAPRDLDQDGAPDYIDLDADGDGLADAGELGCPASTDPFSADTDQDGYIDSAEIAYGSSPCDSGAGVVGFYFVLAPGQQVQQDNLLFGDTNIDRADLALSLDTTGSMGSELQNLQLSLSTLIIPGVQAAVPDPAFGVVAYEDFPLAPYGNSGTRPFRLGARITTDGPSAQAALNALSISTGADIPESGIEALYQIASGVGVNWTGGSVPPFDPMLNSVPGVSDGTIGGVGFRAGALPVVVHVTDAISHDAVSYAPAITAASAQDTKTALSNIGARVITLSSALLPKPVAPEVMDAHFNGFCDRTAGRIFGQLDAPPATDTDWFELQGASAGDVLSAEVFAARIGSPLDPTVGIYDGAGTRLGINDDMVLGDQIDALLSITLSGPTPYYVAVSGSGDVDFNGSGAATSGHYLLEVRHNGELQTRAVAECPADDGTRLSASLLAPLSGAAPAADIAACVAGCQTQLGEAPFLLPYGIAQETGASVPSCAWDEFGSRPPSCAPGQCCTGLNGSGVAPNARGECPLAFELEDDGTGLSQAALTGIEALLGFSTFEITTEVRADPAELGSSGIDTRCFIHSVVPSVAQTANSCAPGPTIFDSDPSTTAADTFRNVTPGTTLNFVLNAQNRDLSPGPNFGQPCATAAGVPRMFRAFVDVIADGVTVVDTQDVLIIVPPVASGSGN